MIAIRSGGVCEMCTNATASQIHHRCPRQSGKYHPPWMSTASNGLALCLRCHEWIEGNRTAAYASGWLVRKPIATRAGGCSTLPVTDPTGRKWLFNDFGQKHPAPA